MGNVVFWQKVLSQLGFYTFLGLLYRLLEDVFADCCGLGALSVSFKQDSAFIRRPSQAN